MIVLIHLLVKLYLCQICLIIYKMYLQENEMINPALNKPLSCIIISGDDQTPDPQQSGRVKVLCPSIHDVRNFDVDSLPWSQLGTNSQDNGHLSFNRPPPPGTLCIAEMVSNAGHFVKEQTKV